MALTRAACHICITYPYIRLYDVSAGGFASQLPRWLTQDVDRGLIGWGDTSKQRNRTPMSRICKKIILEAVDKWMETIGLPPVIVGESKSQAIASKRYTPPKSGRKQAKWGITKGQSELIPLQLPHAPIDLQIVFVTVATAYYNKRLNPVNENGTDASLAVFGFLLEKKPLRKLLGIMKSKLQKLANKTFISKVGRFNTYLHDVFASHIHTICLHDIYAGC